MRTLQPEQPANGILKKNDYGNYISYQVECSCSSPDDSIIFDISAEEDTVELTTYLTAKTDWHYEIINKNNPKIKNSWLFAIDSSLRYLINSIGYKIKFTFELWTSGYIRLQHSTLMNEQQSLTLAYVIQTSMEQVKEYNKEKTKLSE